MSKRIKIKIQQLEILAELNDSITAQKIWDALPIETAGKLWGDEIYFSIPVEMGEENPKETVEKGDIAYWPKGSAFCIFFGPTPISGEGEIRPASAVNIVGKISGDTEKFKNYKSGEIVKIEKGHN